MKLREVAGLCLLVFIGLVLITCGITPSNGTRVEGAVHEIAPHRSLRTAVNNDTILWYLHMQKTGGTFFSAFLLFAFDCVCPPQWRPEWAWSFSCHCPRKIMSMFSPGNASIYHANYTRILRHYVQDGYAAEYPTLQVFTLLREPVARVVSEYHHCSKRRKHACWGSFRNVLDKDWLRIRRFPNVFLEHPGYEGHNRQTRMLLGEAWRDAANDTDVERELVQLAKNRLDELFFVGLSERLEDSMRLFCWQFCLPCTEQREELTTLLTFQINVQRSGYTTSRPFSEALMEWIQMKNKVDSAVYRYAQELFERRVAMMDRGEKMDCGKADT